MLLQKINSIFHPQEQGPNANMSKEPSEVVELEDRDPNDLTKNLQVSWEEIIGEPRSIRSPECAWSVSNQCFRLSRNCFYICLSVILAPIFALLLGLIFALLSFLHIWVIIPTLRIWRILCVAARNFVTAFTYAIIIPFASAFGYFWSEIKIKTHAISEDVHNTEKKDELLVV